MISRIDHCIGMLTNVSYIAYGVSTSPMWTDLTDHLPLIVQLKIPKLARAQKGYHPKGHIHSLNAKALKENDDILEYQATIREVMSDLGDIPTEVTAK